MADNLEVLKIAYRQTKDGYAVTFRIHPNDDHEMIAKAPVGTRFALAAIPIADDESHENREAP